MQALTPKNKVNRRNPVILSADDDEDNSIYISQALKLFEYRVIATTEPRNVVSLAQECQPDLILLDIKMPYLSGIDLIKILKCDWLTRNIPTVAVTALAREKEKSLILNAGFTDYLIKPFLLEELKSVVCSHTKNISFY